MIIKIEFECTKLIGKEEKYKIFFSSIAYEINRGNNYYYFSKRTLEALYNNEYLEDGPKNIYKRLFDNCYEDNLILKSVNRKIIIKNTTKNADNIILEGQNYLISIDLFIEMNYSYKMNLIAENNTDCNFYKKIGLIYMKKKNIASVRLELENQPGGGSTINDIVRNKYENKQISVAYVDSDVKYFKCAEGETSKKLLKEIKRLNRKYNNDIVEIQKVDAHEVENLIPIKMIKNYYRQNRNEESRDITIDFLKKINTKKLDINNPIIYFDMKNGIDKETCCKNEDYRNYWKDVLEKNSYIYDENSLIDGFGKRLLEKMDSFIEKEIELPDFYSKNIDNYLRKKWNEIGRTIYSYGCARERRSC